MGCAVGCRADGCLGGQACDPATRRCTAAAPCAADGDCDVDQYCREDQTCATGCRVGACPVGQACDPESRACSCRRDDGCPDGQYCLDAQCLEGCRLDPDDCGPGAVCDVASRACQCVDDTGCAADAFCAQGACQGGCRLDPDNCGEGSACDPARHQCACTGDADCPEATWCDAGFCTPGCRTEPDNCSAGNACDPASRACLCQGDAGCADAAYCGAEGACAEGCRLEPDNCGEGSACDMATRRCGCLSDAVCAAEQYCAADGTCQPGCRVEDAACPAGYACDAEARDCRCADDSACAAGQYCGAEGACVAGCRSEPDDCAVGSCDPQSRRCRCAADAECADNLYCGDDGTCQVGCRLEPDNCPQGRCEAASRLCRAPSCGRDGDCPMGQVCALNPAEGGGIELRCAPPLANGGSEDPCARNVQCGARLCVDERYCFSACTDNADCPGGRCEPIRVNGPGVDEVTELNTCALPPLVCGADAECAEGRVCLPNGEDPAQPNRPIFECLGPPPGGRTGDACGADGDCVSGTCVEGVCWGPCRRGQADCRAGQVCYEDSIIFTFDQGTPAPRDDRFFGAAACLPDVGSGDRCPDARCPAGETCTLQGNGTLTAFVNTCRDIVGPRLGGAFCNFDADCQSGVCVTDGFCLAVCSPANPGLSCAPGASVCIALDLTLWDAGTPNDRADDRTSPVNICLPQ